MVPLDCFTLVVLLASLTLCSSWQLHRHMSMQCENSAGSTPTSRSLRERRREKQKASVVPQQDSSNSLAQKYVDIPNEAAPSFIIPSDTASDHLISQHRLRFYGFDELFPSSNLGEVFESNSAFRLELRISARLDFFIPCQHTGCNALNNHQISMMSTWANSNQYLNISKTFKKYGIINLSGFEFVHKLTFFCTEGRRTFGSWMDIIGVKNRHISHSWHQDSGLDQVTVMVGFPKEDKFEGVGVFSHVVKLSHRMAKAGTNGSEPVLWTNVFDEKYIIRPSFKRGKEVMVYNDEDVVHSAPDFAIRDSIWRFM